MRHPRAKSFYRIQNAAADEATVYIYDEISWFAVNAQQFARDLQAVSAKQINLRINSPGGNVFDGIAIYNELRRHPARVVAHVDGVAASIASVIAMAGDEIHMSQGAMLMIHNAWGIGIGDADELRKTADLFDKATDQIRGIYARRTGLSDNALRDLMDDETWMDGDEAVAKGFADETDDTPAAKAAFDFSAFRNTPQKLAAAARPEAPKIETIRDFEEALREHMGFSHAAARSIAAGGFKPQSEPRDEDDGLADIAAMLARRGSAIANLSTR